MRHFKGASAPFFSRICAPAKRDNQLLTMAVEALAEQNYADALIASEYVCRHLPGYAIPALLRARILDASCPELAAKAWYQAWCCNPQDPTAQDAMLHCWLKSGALESVRELGCSFLPERCKAGNEGGLITLLKQAGLRRAGACWKDGDNFAGMVLSLDDHASTKCDLILANETTRTQLSVSQNGQHFNFTCPPPNGVWSLAFADTTAILQGSPLVFAPPEASPATDSKPASDACIDIIIPVYRGLAQVRACITSVLESRTENQNAAELIVIDDASPDAELSAWLDTLAAKGQITLMRNDFNLGFIETVNRGLRLHTARDVVLLNADTLVHGDWIDRLKSSLYSDIDIASVTPWSNNGEMTSFPKIATAALMPNTAQLRLIDATAAALHRSGEIADIVLPCCCGFAMMMRRRVLEQIGLLDGASLVRGYSEEVDWCLRAGAAGYRHLAATGVFIAHSGGVSFGFEKILRVRQNREIVIARYPTYPDDYGKFLEDDPLCAARAALGFALAKTCPDWLDAEHLKRKASPHTASLMPAALPSRCDRVAVWQHSVTSPHAKKILALARAIATRRVPLRLLIFGAGSEALWQTGVVDVLPSKPGGDVQHLSDITLLGLSGVTLLLHEAGEPPLAEITSVRIDARFDPEAWIKERANHS